jgi:hypothetical protein
MTGAETHRFTEFELVIGGGSDAAVRIEQRRIVAR